jgi:hypothetical protein
LRRDGFEINSLPPDRSRGRHSVIGNEITAVNAVYLMVGIAQSFASEKVDPVWASQAIAQVNSAFEADGW